MNNLKLSTIVCSLIIFSPLKVRGEDAKAEWFAEKQAVIDRAKVHYDDKAIEELGMIVRGIGSKLSIAPNEGKLMFSEASYLLISHQNFCDFYDRQLKESRANSAIESERRVKAGGKPYWGSYDNDRMFIFQTMTFLPSPQTVKFLGEYLDDLEETQEEIKLGDTPDSFGPSSNASLAGDALKKLIAKLPPGVDPIFGNPSDVKRWKIWYEQVKEGRLTYQFKGDPTEYDLDGPVSQEKMERIEKNRLRDEEHSAGQRKRTPVSEGTPSESAIGKQSFVAAILVAFVFVAVSVWYFLCRRRMAR